MELTYISHMLLACLGLLLVFLALDAYLGHRRKNRPLLVSKHTEEQQPEEELKEAPGPRSWPLLGSLHLLGGYEVPYAAFSALAKRYGDVIKMNLGSQRCVVVNGLKNIREVLITKGAQFDGRPNFARFHQLFCGDKENSLAFCDWSDLQKVRREMLRSHTFPRAFSTRFHQLDDFLNTEMQDLTNRLDATSGQVIAIKPELLHACANVFSAYFCSKRFSREDEQFNLLISHFDSIFYEVNQGYAADFLPWLMPLHTRHLAQMKEWSMQIRHIMDESIIKERLERTERGELTVVESGDYVQALIEHVNSPDGEKLLTWDSAMFALEDILGGHSAVGNLLVKTMAFVASRPEVQRRVKEEADTVTGDGSRTLKLEDRTAMPYTDAVTFEAIRLISSPIVPHVANQDSSIAGFHVEKDSLIFLNNYELNMSPDLWEEPSSFKPERFLDASGRLVKPEYFLPFGGGRRSCMGYKMVQFLSFAILGTLLQRYSLEPLEDYKVPIGDLALPKDTFKFRFIRH